MSITKRLLIFGFFLAIGTNAYAADKTVVVDDTFTKVTLVSWSSGQSYVAMVKIIEIDGAVALCGAGNLRGADIKALTFEALRKTDFTINDIPVLRGITHFSNVRKRSKLKSAVANCKKTRYLWSSLNKNSQLDFNARQTTFRD